RRSGGDVDPPRLGAFERSPWVSYWTAPLSQSVDPDRVETVAVLVATLARVEISSEEAACLRAIGPRHDLRLFVACGREIGDGH
ncbi:MAG: hypothetical protein V3T83_15630, partial [Acidobacteriota bacterium]